MDAHISAMRDELEQLDARLENDIAKQQQVSKHDWEAIDEWYANFSDNAVRMPLSQSPPHDTNPNSPIVGPLCEISEPSDQEVPFIQTLDGKPQTLSLLVDGRQVNEALLSIGTRVELWWNTKSYTTCTGKLRHWHKVVRGRFKLGQQQGQLPGTRPRT